MSAGFRALRDDYVGARLLGLFAVMHLAAHNEYLHSMLVHGADELGGDSQAGDEDFHLLLDQDRHVRPYQVRNRREQVNRERLVGEFARAADFLAQLRGRASGRADHPETARVGNRRDQPMHGYAAHPGQQYWILDTEIVANRSMKHRVTLQFQEREIDSTKTAAPACTIIYNRTGAECL